MTVDAFDRAPLAPAIHLAPSRGWMNDPNGLCYVDGVWHAFFQYDPDTDVHGVMHWGHATSVDLARWVEQPLALVPDEHGVIFSGSAVVDIDNTAGFGAGAMVAIFTHHVVGAQPAVQRQSLAYSLDQGVSWQKYAGNPVLESDEADFRDPKVIRHLRDGSPEWVMSLAVGRRVEFYRSNDLRQWTQTGTFECDVPTSGVWECPDLMYIADPGREPHWFLAFGVIDGGPQGHSGTYVVAGDFDGDTFTASGEATLLDHGPDYYAAQSFFGAPGGACVQIGWLSSWRYAQTHPSRGRRGLQSIPRRLSVNNSTAPGRLSVTPYPDLAAIGTSIDQRRWVSEPGRALHIDASGEVDVTITTGWGTAAKVSITAELLSLERHGEGIDHYAQTYTATIDVANGRHQIVIDHGTIEVFAADGTATVSALYFAGDEWTVDVDGLGHLSVI